MTGLGGGEEPRAAPARVTGIRGWRGNVWRWIDRRTGADELLHQSLDEPIPGGARFAYVFGSALLFLFVSQIITGVCLAVYYVPSPLTAHVTLSYIIKDVAGGAFLRSLHSYGSSAMVVVLVLHFLQTVLYGSYKGKREVLWIAGCVLALLVLGMTFTGYLLRWDLKAYFAGSVGTSIAGDVPLIGSWLLKLLRGGSAMGALTLSRFYVLHVFLLPATILLFVAVHVFLFRKAGAAGPITADPVDPRLPTETFYPRQVIIDMAFVLLVMGVLGTLAHFVPATLGPVADPSNSSYLPRPEWYYLPFFEWLKFWNGATTVIGVVVIPIILIGLVILLPFFDRGRERRPWKRVIPVGSVLVVLIGLLGLGLQSRLDDSRNAATAAQIAQQDLAEIRFLHAPFAPYSIDSISPVAGPVGLSGIAIHGKGIFASQGCAQCHGPTGAGGAGPPLTDIADKLSPAQLTALLQAPSVAMKAGGMIPLAVDASDMAALVAFVNSLGAAAGVSAPNVASAAVPPPSDGGTPAPTAASRHIQAASPPLPAAPADASPPTTSGVKMYESEGCRACHGEGGQGTPRGPSLVDVGGKLSAVQLTALFRTPTAAMTAGGMPRVTGTSSAVASLVAYVRSLQSTALMQPASAKTAAEPRPAEQAAAPATSVTATPVKGVDQSPAAHRDSVTTGHPEPSPAQRGASLFVSLGCAACHGSAGVGTATAPALTKVSQTITAVALTGLLEHPTQKMHAGGMPATTLNAVDMSALVGYLQHLGTPSSAPALTSRSAAGPLANPVAGAASQHPMNALELQGQSVFAAHSCATCHGAKGVGGTWAAPALANTGKDFPPAVLATLLRHPAARMKQGGMPSLSVSSGELDALVAYVRFIAVRSTGHGAAPDTR